MPPLPVEIEVQGTRYRYTRLPALTQFHVLRRLAPVLPSFASLLAIAQDTSNSADLLERLQPIVDAIGKMSDADADYVIHAALDRVLRQQGDNSWAPVRANKTLMFDDMSLPVLLQLTVAVLTESLRGFFPEPPGSASTATSRGG